MLFLRDDRGSSAAEFALILPIFLLFLLGLIDVGRFAWSFNELEKSTQTGARWAVATDIIPSGLIDYSFAVSSAVPQGTPVKETEFSAINCIGSGSVATPTATCSCAPARSGGSTVCPTGLSLLPGTRGTAAFKLLLARMNQIYPSIQPANLVVSYVNSGLGFSGDPNGPDVAPIVTVSVQNLQFPLLFMLGTSVGMPTSRYSMTLEDGQGTVSN